jgi:hypothetical protein
MTKRQNKVQIKSRWSDIVMNVMWTERERERERERNTSIPNKVEEETKFVLHDR